MLAQNPFIEWLKPQLPKPLAWVMQQALTEPTLGYYTTQNPFGAKGDFITAPDISQLFGETVAVWLVAQWQALGSPKVFNWVELGAGRGTLLADMWRATKAWPAFQNAANIFSIEVSPQLRQVQADAWQGINVQWLDYMAELPAAPTIFIGNEFLDALPIDNYVFDMAQGWQKQYAVDIGVFENQALDATDMVQNFLPQAAEQGDVYEFSAQTVHWVSNMLAWLQTHGGAVWLADYGHVQNVCGQTLQAVKNHAYADVWQTLGQADLTAHVNFAVLNMLAAEHGVPPTCTTQGEFLLAYGIRLRAEKLLAQATDVQAVDINAGLQRLCDPDKMGELFKVWSVSVRYD